jgi:hypothetical protein
MSVSRVGFGCYSAPVAATSFGKAGVTHNTSAAYAPVRFGKSVADAGPIQNYLDQLLIATELTPHHSGLRLNVPA